MVKQTWGYRLSPREWPFLFRSLRETPDDVALGARIFFALGGHDEGPTYRRLLRSREGAHLAENRIGYPALLTDYDRLRALPKGTLGREYVDRLDERSIHPAGIIEATRPVYDEIDFSPDHAYAELRISPLEPYRPMDRSEAFASVVGEEPTGSPYAGT